jgi:ribosomal silencing factor RsfS
LDAKELEAKLAQFASKLESSAKAVDALRADVKSKVLLTDWTLTTHGTRQATTKHIAIKTITSAWLLACRSLRCLPRQQR